MILSAIICTHNPKEYLFLRVLQALEVQTLPNNLWELIIIDNSSSYSVEDAYSLSWHPHSRVVIESNLGLTPARLRGIRESASPLLVFIDDDNILDNKFLEKVVAISDKWPMLGVWGGQVHPEFEEDPPEWTKSYWTYLAIREFSRDNWSNLHSSSGAEPCGAGLCLRKEVAEHYMNQVTRDSIRTQLDRKGNDLSSGGDTDIALTACDMGLGMGVFTDLHLTHIMPRQRLSEEYLIRLMESLKASHIILNYIRTKKILPPKDVKWWVKHYYRSLFYQGRTLKFYLASVRAEEKARAFFKTYLN